MFKLTKANKAAIKSYLRGVLAAGAAYALANAANFGPVWGILAGAVAGPLAKALDKSEPDFGAGTK